MIPELLNSYRALLENIGLSEQFALLIENTSVFIVIILLAFLSDRLTKGILIRVIGRIVKRSKNKYDDILLKRKVFQRIAHIAPALIVNAMIVFLIDPSDLGTEEISTATFSAGNVIAFIRTITKIYIVVISSMVLESVISAAHEIYMQLPISKGRNIKGYVQLVKILTYIVAALVVISILTTKSIGGLLTGLGAFAAVLMLIFKDTILGLVASIQLSGNKMVSIGDWISMPKYDADGDVIDISLNTVKVQNWDKTIATIPTYALVTNSFNNWKGMEESGGRRIKRSINIDMQSVHFIDTAMLNKYREIKILKAYIDERLVEIDEYNKKIGTNNSDTLNGRQLTNLGSFRKYLEFYLRNNPNIKQDMTFLVRHLQPTELGLPIEIYVFSNDQRWANYEVIQADIFDHILAVIPVFELRVFQSPSGADWRELGIGQIAMSK
ncbi:MAG: mechanosensitive ion channel [Bacteroidales bacterium]|jgi:miniconductance mechanosensitive channel|nr:mechanosensitive ion channel [Bacteroidales bacterium]